MNIINFKRLLLLSIFLLLVMTAESIAATVTFKFDTIDGDLIYDHSGVSGTLIEAGKTVQIIYFYGSYRAPLYPKADGSSNTGDNLKLTGQTTTAGSFVMSNVNIPDDAGGQDCYVYIRVWEENYPGAGASYYGDSNPQQISFAGNVHPTPHASFAATKTILTTISKNSFYRGDVNVSVTIDGYYFETSSDVELPIAPASPIGVNITGGSAQQLNTIFTVPVATSANTYSLTYRSKAANSQGASVGNPLSFTVINPSIALGPAGITQPTSTITQTVMITGTGTHFKAKPLTTVTVTGGGGKVTLVEQKETSGQQIEIILQVQAYAPSATIVVDTDMNPALNEHEIVSKVFTISVGTFSITTTPEQLAASANGATYAYQLEAAGGEPFGYTDGKPIYEWAMSGPGGLSLTSSGYLSGTAVGVGSTATLEIWAKDKLGVSVRFDSKVYQVSMTDQLPTGSGALVVGPTAVPGSTKAHALWMTPAVTNNDEVTYWVDSPGENPPVKGSTVDRMYQHDVEITPLTNDMGYRYKVTSN